MQGGKAGGCTQLRKKGTGEKKGSELRVRLFHLKIAQGMLVAPPGGMDEGNGSQGPKRAPPKPC